MAQRIRSKMGQRSLRENLLKQKVMAGMCRDQKLYGSTGYCELPPPNASISNDFICQFGSAVVRLSPPAHAIFVPSAVSVIDPGRILR
jgi:hypothetical protein